MEKMLVAEALDKRDFLAKKISDEIRRLEPISVKRKGDPRIKETGQSVEDFEKDAKSTYQSINDMISLYDRINVAVTLHNAETKITVNGKEMTVAEAITRRKSLTMNSDFRTKLREKLENCFNRALVMYNNLDRDLINSREQLVNGLLANQGPGEKKSNIDEIQAKSIDIVIDPMTPEYIDPLNLKTEIEKLDEETSELISKINTAIKVSNASTYVEV